MKKDGLSTETWNQQISCFSGSFKTLSVIHALKTSKRLLACSQTVYRRNWEISDSQDFWPKLNRLTNKLAPQFIWHQRSSVRLAIACLKTLHRKTCPWWINITKMLQLSTIRASSSNTPVRHMISRSTFGHWAWPCSSLSHLNLSQISPSLVNQSKKSYRRSKLVNIWSISDT